jgi:predicted ATP-grasp superfamily ATP-dependent carboligase
VRADLGGRQTGARRSRPRLAVVFGLGASGPFDVLAAAGDELEVVFVYDSRNEYGRASASLLAELAPSLDLASLGPDGVAAALREQVDGLTTFSDEMLPTAAALAARLALRFHSPEATQTLVDKQRQRVALCRAEIPGPRFKAVRSALELDDALDKIGLPAVLKPVRGTGSESTFRVGDRADAEAAARLAWAQDPRRVFLLEELLVGAPHPAADWLGDYVSVESVSFGGSRHHFCVVDKSPLAPPFRETGMVLPSSVPLELRRELEELASRALDACGLAEGASQTEIKLTPEGPRVIEVNGRLGGSIARLAKRVSSLDPVRMAIDVAVGRAPAVPQDFRALSIQYHVPAPMEAVALDREPDLERVRTIVGVYAVESNLRAGAPLDWQTGTLGRICTVWAESGDLAAARQVFTAVDAVVAESARFRTGPR